MKESDYKEFIKRYDQFKKNNLPTPFWDEERQTLEYVYFYNGKSIYNSKKAKGELEVYPNLTEALSDIAFIGFYYPFTGKHMMTWRENGKLVQKAVVEHDHAHSFEEVVKALYTSPESFYIASDEEQYYSKQELIYLRRVQKYLLLIGMKDLEVGEVSNSRFQNKIHAKYENVFIYRFSDDALKDILNGLSFIAAAVSATGLFNILVNAIVNAKVKIDTITILNDAISITLRDVIYSVLNQLTTYGYILLGVGFVVILVFNILNGIKNRKTSENI